MTELTAEQRERARGVLVGLAIGNALGAPFEFGPALGPEASFSVAMTGGGAFGWEPGGWTDDTCMAIVIAEVAATGLDLRSETAQDAIVAGWSAWAGRAPRVGVQTSSVLQAAKSAALAEGVPSPGARHARVASREFHRLHAGRSSGNGSLVRTAPVALAYLDDEAGLVEAAGQLSALTHFDPEAGEACVLWCLAIRHAVLTGQLEIRAGLKHFTGEREAVWLARLHAAEERSLSTRFVHTGWVMEALQGAWSAIYKGRGLAVIAPADPPEIILYFAVDGGGDTDTVAAIAGSLAGGVYGADWFPAEWTALLHGWPDLDVAGLTEIADSIVTADVLE